MNRTTVHPNPRLLALPQAAAEFGISTGTLRKLIHEGHLPVVRMPGVRRVLINRRVLEERIEKTWKGKAS